MASTPFSKLAMALIGLLFASLFFGAFRGMDDPDIWFQLLAGRYFLTHGEVPHSDFFIYAGRDLPQMFGGWGFGALYEMAMAAFGPVGSTLLNAAIWTGAFFCATKAASLRAGRGLLTLSPQACLALSVAMSALCVCIVSRMNMRAESTLFLAWTASFWLFEHARAHGKLSMFWVGMPLIAWAEAWMHTGGFVLLAIIPIAAAHVAQDQGRKFWTLKGLSPWLLCLAATAILPIFNPNGADQPYIQLRGLLGLFVSDLTGGDGFQNMEYLPAWDSRLSSLRPNFAVLAIILMAVWARRPKLGSVVEGLAATAFFAMACLHNRGIGMAALVAMVPLLSQAIVVGSLNLRLSHKTAAALALLFALAPLGVGYSSGQMRTQSEGSSLDQAAAIVKLTRPDGANIFTMESGPQLAYALNDERYLIASTGHLLLPNPTVSEHVARVVNAQADWLGELEREKVDFVCLPLYLSLPDAGIFYWLPSMLATRDDWKFYPTSGPCSLFMRLSASQKLTPEEVEEQTMLYLQNLRLAASFHLDNPSHPDKVGRELDERAKKGIAAIEAKRNAKAGDKEKPSP